MLLSKAMHRAEPPNQIDRWYADYTSTRKKVSQLGHRQRIRPTIKGRHDDATVGDIKVRVRGGQPVPIANNRSRHRECLDAKRSPTLIAHRVQPLQVVLEHMVVDVRGIV